jgi:hypothetical protein
VEFGSSSHFDAVVDSQKDVVKPIGYNLRSVRVYRTYLFLDASVRRHGPKLVQGNCTSFGRKNELVLLHTCKQQMFTLLDFRLPTRSKWELVSYYSERIVVSWRHFRTTYRSYFRESRIFNYWPLKIGPIGGHEMSPRNYQFSLTNNPEECSYTYRRKPEITHVANCKNRYLLYNGNIIVVN